MWEVPIEVSAQPLAGKAAYFPSLDVVNLLALVCHTLGFVLRGKRNNGQPRLTMHFAHQLGLFMLCYAVNRSSRICQKHRVLPHRLLLL